MYGKLKEINGNDVTINVADDVDISKIQKYTTKSQPDVELVVNDGRHITPNQRKKIFAMMNEISDYTGYPAQEVEYRAKCKFVTLMQHPSNFSFSNCSMTIANNFLTFLISFCITQDIPFKTKVFDSISNSYLLEHECLLKRLCVVCGRPGADIDHWKAIGAGRNRNTINHVGMSAISLCREHHTEAHKIGHLIFAQKYQVKPIKLTKDDVIKLNLMGKNQLNKYENKEASEE